MAVQFAALYGRKKKWPQPVKSCGPLALPRLALPFQASAMAALVNLRLPAGVSYVEPTARYAERVNIEPPTEQGGGRASGCHSVPRRAFSP